MLWNELDGLVRFATKADINVLEDDLIADAHSHPGRVNNNDITTAVQRCWETIIRAS